jgi:hypothetical protein
MPVLVGCTATECSALGTCVDEFQLFFPRRKLGTQDDLSMAADLVLLTCHERAVMPYSGANAVLSAELTLVASEYKMVTDLG